MLGVAVAWPLVGGFANADEARTVWVDAEVEAPVALGRLAGCHAVEVAGAADARLELAMHSAEGNRLGGLAVGVGRVEVSFCSHDDTEFFAVVVAGRAGLLTTRTRPAEFPSAVEVLEHSVSTLGPGASFHASRRLAARLEADQRRGHRPAGPPFDLVLEADRSSTVEMPAGTRCLLMLVEVGEGTLRMEGRPPIGAGESGRFAVCVPDPRVSGGSIRYHAEATPLRARAAFLVPTTEPFGAVDEVLPASPSEPTFLGRLVAAIAPTGIATPVPLSLDSPGCISVIAVGRGAAEVALVDAEGRWLGRSVRGDGPARVHACALEASRWVAFVRVARGADPARVFVREAPTR